MVQSANNSDGNDTPSVPPITIDPHDGATAEEVGAFYQSVAPALAQVAINVGARPCSITAMWLFDTRGGEIAIPEGDRAAVDAIGDVFKLGNDTTTPILYQRTGDCEVAGTRIFLRVFCYLLDELVAAEAAETAQDDDAVHVDVPVVPLVPAPSTEVDVLPAQPVPSA